MQSEEGRLDDAIVVLTITIGLDLKGAQALSPTAPPC